MKCRAKAARYYGIWAAEGLCRPCVTAMPPEVRIKVIRDMHAEDRKKWQVDNAIADPWAEKPDPDAPPAGPTEEDLERMMEACEAGEEGVPDRDVAASSGRPRKPH